MAEINIEQKKELAELLFTRNELTQKEVAKRVGVTEKTMSKWINAYNWEDLKTSITITRQGQIRRLYMQIAEINKKIENQQEGERFASSKEADIITKIAAAIDKLERETGIVETLDVSTAFLDWLRKSNVDKAKELSQYFDAYIKHMLR